ncbi:MAG: glycosyltransferase [Kiritimatiellae bacterium]|nr:glycosyltransferase [Kiritimatiellia bacterium]
MSSPSTASQTANAVAAPGNRPTIAGVVIVYNEEHHIRGCLESLRDCVDEIVVVHDGPCADRTLEIAREFTDKVLVHDRMGNNDPLTPYALNQTNCEWVIQIDADERLSPGLRAELADLVSRPGVDAYALMFPFTDPATGKPDLRYRKYRTALFRREKIYKVGIPHAKTMTRGVQVQIDSVVEHLVTYPDSAHQLLRSFTRKNADRSLRAARALCGDLSDIPVFNVSLTQDTQLRLVRKLLLQRRHPLLTLLVLPPYSFLHLYFTHGRYKGGLIGLADALNVPMFHAWTCLRIIKHRLTGRF